MVKEISAGGVIENNGKIVLVFQEKSKTWTLPKGRTNKKESIGETALREIYEETGIKNLKFIKMLGSYVRGHKEDPRLRKKIVILQFITSEDNLDPNDPEISFARWVAIDEVENFLSYKKDKEFFLQVKGLL